MHTATQSQLTASGGANSFHPVFYRTSCREADSSKSRGLIANEQFGKSTMLDSKDDPGQNSDASSSSDMAR